ncbi:LacI family DNA-binding transcriptional regulator [Pacificibacter marinus]|nr:LacI family DNA-binding transcriptional regulator [Pacificibacter marinus]
MAKKTSLEDIAKAANVSIATVDRVVNQRGGVSPKSEAKVLDWAARLNLDRKIFRTSLKSLRIAVLIPPVDNPFFAAVRDAFVALDGSSNTAQIRSYIHTFDPVNMRDAARKIDQLSLEYDGIIVCCPDHPDTSAAATRASLRIPVVTLVNDLPRSGRLAYVGPDNRQIGRVAGELMGRFLGPQGGKVLVMLGHHRISGHQDREMGFRSITRERFPNVEILDIAESDEDSTRAAQIAQHALHNELDIRGIYNVSAGNYQIAQTLIKLGRSEEIVFITHELTTKRCELLKIGLLDAVIDQNPRMEARHAIDVLAHHFKRTEAYQVPDPFTPFEIFLRENCPDLV